MDINDLISTYKPVEDQYVEEPDNLYETYLGIKSSTPHNDYNFSKPYSFTTQAATIPVSTTVQNDSSKSPIEMLQQEGIDFRITSGYRPGARTSSGHASNHSKKDSNGNSLAYDIVPTEGHTFADLKNEIYSNPRLVNYFKNKNIGILEETSKEVMSKTHATGPHFHIGPDTWAVQMFNNNLQSRKAQDGMKFSELTSSYKPIDDIVDDDEKIEIPKQRKFSDDFNTTIDQDIREVQDLMGQQQTQQTQQTQQPQETQQPALDIQHKFGQTDKKVKEYVDVMKPIFSAALANNGIEVNNNTLSEAIKATGLESNYGLSPRGNGYNLGGIKGPGTKYKDGNSYRDFDNLYSFADYYVKLLNNKYDAFNAKDLNDFVGRLHGNNKDHASYSASPQTYKEALSRMTQIDRYLS